MREGSGEQDFPNLILLWQGPQISVLKLFLGANWCGLARPLLLLWVRRTGLAGVAGASDEVCALYPPVKEKVHCSALNSVKNLVMHRIRWQIQHWFFHSAEKSIFFNDYFITDFGDDLLATNSSLNPVMKIGLFSFVIVLVTEFSAYVCTEVDEHDFSQDFSTELSEKLCASLNSMTN